MHKWPSLDQTSAGRVESLRDAAGELTASLAVEAAPWSCSCAVEYRRHLDPQRSRQVADAMARAAMATLTRMEAEASQDLPIPYQLVEIAAQ
jgi:hypothetical protein